MYDGSSTLRDGLILLVKQVRSHFSVLRSFQPRSVRDGFRES